VIGYLRITAVVVWLQTTADADLHLSAVTLGETQAGIEHTREQDATKASEIEAWAGLVAASYTVLPMDGEKFRTWARLMYRKLDALYADAILAATAIVHKLTISTRNVADFADFDVHLLNPFETMRNWRFAPAETAFCARARTSPPPSLPAGGSRGNHPLERGVLERMILRLHGEALLGGIKRLTFGDRPRLEHAIAFEAKVIMQPARGRQCHSRASLWARSGPRRLPPDGRSWRC
jgi:predicted nucleic acid-binding protein